MLIHILLGGIFMLEKRKSGILVHPTSFPSKFGIGDLGKGAFDFIDFLVKSKQSLWQILPLGHTSFGDSPYQSFSTFAGNPLLISPELLYEENLLSKEDIDKASKSDPNKVDYGKVIEFKMKIFRKAFENFDLKDEKVRNDFIKFSEENKYWLDDYCLFISIKNHFIEKRKGTFETDEYNEYKKENIDTIGKDGVNDCFYGACWNSWDKNIASRKNSALIKYTKSLKDEILFYKFLQFEFYKQWSKLKKYANENGIEIIGDVPIFVAADSADTWSNREFFHIDSKGFPTEVAGVPPDYFSKTGQLWGNPLYNWENLKNDKYGWWVKRIQHTLKLVDYIRIDHFRAFESYWSIPYGEKTAINGKWKKGPNKQFFDVIENELGQLPIIAEDLGDLNDEVIKLRDELKFPGMKILQFAFEDDCKNVYLPHNYDNVNCIVYTGTHDNNTSIGWYEKASEKGRDYIRRYLNVSGEHIAWDMIRLAFMSSAKIAIIPIQDIFELGSDARMNTPGVSSGNWQFRYTEDMLKEKYSKQLVYLSKMFNRNLNQIKKINKTDGDDK